MVRRSKHFLGLIPHFAIITDEQEHNPAIKHIMIEYIPKKPGVDFFLLFKGEYQVSRYTLLDTHKFSSMIEVDAFIKNQEEVTPHESNIS